MGIYIEIIPALTESQGTLGDMMTMRQLVLVSEPSTQIRYMNNTSYVNISMN